MLGVDPATASASLSLAPNTALSILPKRISLRPFGGLARPLRSGDPEVDRLAYALSGVLSEVNEIRAPVILVDGLDKIEQPDTIYQLFLQTRLLDLPPCPVVYNGPIALWLSPDYQALISTARFISCPLPNLPVEEPVPGSAQLQPGDLARSREHLREVIAVRLQSQGIRLDDLFEADALETLITASGGVIRDLVHLVSRSCRWAYRQEPHPKQINAALVERAILTLSREVQPGVTNQA